MEQKWFKTELCSIHIAARDQREVIDLMTEGLYTHCFVRESFADAIFEREQSSPTGIPLPRRKVAIPHTDPEHVITPAVALCTLAQPVVFREMGNPDSELPVEFVVMLALTDHESMQGELVRLVGLLQDPNLVDRACSAPDADALLSLLERRD